MQADDLKFEVEGREWPITSVIFHKQVDPPFPGGHFFTVQIADKDLGEAVLSYSIDKSRFPQDVATQAIFDLLHSEAAFLKDYGKKIYWVLNTVDEVRREHEKIIVEGKCSATKSGNLRD
jgi:hypothetical protein